MDHYVGIDVSLEQKALPGAAYGHRQSSSA